MSVQEVQDANRSRWIFASKRQSSVLSTISEYFTARSTKSSIASENVDRGSMFAILGHWPLRTATGMDVSLMVVTSVETKGSSREESKSSIEEIDAMIGKQGSPTLVIAIPPEEAKDVKTDSSQYINAISNDWSNALNSPDFVEMYNRCKRSSSAEPTASVESVRFHVGKQL